MKPVSYPAAESKRLACLCEFLSDARDLLSAAESFLRNTGAPAFLRAKWAAGIRVLRRRVEYCAAQLMGRWQDPPVFSACLIRWPASGRADEWSDFTLEMVESAIGALVLAWPLPEDYGWDSDQYRNAFRKHALLLGRLVDIADDLEAWNCLPGTATARIVQ